MKKKKFVMDVTKGTTCKNIPLYKPIEFDIALKKSAACYKQ